MITAPERRLTSMLQRCLQNQEEAHAQRGGPYPTPERDPRNGHHEEFHATREGGRQSVPTVTDAWQSPDSNSALEKEPHR